MLYVFSDVDRLTFSVSPRDFGPGESSWAGLCFNPSQWSMVIIFLLDLASNFFYHLNSYSSFTA